ncbi:MAG TPA: ATP-binding protein [Rhodoferax sp.]|nr:ATP-binding protein [Rhodoferax sp.]
MHLTSRLGSCLRLRLHLPELPSSLYARLALILLVGLLAAQGISLWLQWGERSAVVTQARGLNFADRLAHAVSVLETVGLAQRGAALAALQYDDLSVTLVNANQVSARVPRGPIADLLAARLGSQRQVRHVPAPSGAHAGAGNGAGGGAGGAAMGTMQGDAVQRSFDVQLQDGQWARVTIRRNTESNAPALSNDLILQLLLTLVIVAAVVMIAVRQATRPLQQLAQAADRLGHDLDAAPLVPGGSTETRRAAQAFNRMQTRIQHLIRERARALAAVSHDLRTPLTRLRLRTELIDDAQLRDQMASDLASMAAMLDTTLDYLRGLQAHELVRPIDINALLESMAEDALVPGRKIRIDGLAQKPFDGRLTALRRALQNLIDNAFKFGHAVCLQVQDDALRLSITVQDDGPGIAIAELGKVVEPYYRVDSARSQAGDGVGLGLSIVRDMALMHGGELLLANRPQGGLAATIILPREQPLAALAEPVRKAV